MNPGYEMTGTVKIIKDLMTFPSGFTKREFVITTEDERFPQPILFSCIKDRTALVDNLTVGERIKVTFDIRGHEYNERFFVDLQAFKIEPLDGAAGADDMPPEDVFADEPPMGGADDIPF